MTVSARLTPKTRTALARYCKRRGITKTQAIERGIDLLLSESQDAKHAAFIAFERLRERPSQKGVVGNESGTSLKQHLDEKYPA